MDALDLIVLGRRLTRIGEEILRQSVGPSFTTGPSLVLRDVLAHPGAPISDIAERTSLPQSYVSESVAKLVERGVLQTASDPGDKRRTLVRVSNGHLRTVAQRGRTSISAAVAESLGSASPDVTREVLSALAMLSDRFQPETTGPILRQMRDPDSTRG